MSDSKYPVQSVTELQLKREAFITFVSQRGSGKSVLLADVIYYYMHTAEPENRCDFAYLFSATAAINRETNHSLKFFDARAILDPTDEVVDPFVERLKKNQEATKFKHHVLLIFDDIDVTHRYKSLNFLASRGRHYAITVLLSSQISNCALSPTVRSNTDYVFWRRLGEDDLKKNVAAYMTLCDFKTKNELIDFTLANTNNYQFISYDNKIEDVSKKIRLTRAEEVPESYQYAVQAPTPQPRRARPPSRWGRRW